MLVNRWTCMKCLNMMHTDVNELLAGNPSNRPIRCDKCGKTDHLRWGGPFDRTDQGIFNPVPSNLGFVVIPDAMEQLKAEYPPHHVTLGGSQVYVTEDRIVEMAHELLRSSTPQQANAIANVLAAWIILKRNMPS